MTPNNSVSNVRSDVVVEQKQEMNHFMQCRLGDNCNTCRQFLEGFKK